MTYLGSHELGSTTEGASTATVPHVLLTETIVCNLDMAIQCQEDVIKLQVTINDTIFMEVLESQANLCGIKPARQNVNFQLRYIFPSKDRLTVPFSNRIDLAEYEA